jgi:hypothetical protein
MGKEQTRGGCAKLRQQPAGSDEIVLDANFVPRRQLRGSCTQHGRDRFIHAGSSEGRQER